MESQRIISGQAILPLKPQEDCISAILLQPYQISKISERTLMFGKGTGDALSHLLLLGNQVNCLLAFLIFSIRKTAGVLVLARNLEGTHQRLANLALLGIDMKLAKQACKLRGKKNQLD